MACLELPESLTEEERQCKRAYELAKAQGLDLSRPMELADLRAKLALCRERFGNGQLELVALMERFPDTPMSIGEEAAFPIHGDVYPYPHLRYFPVPLHAHEYFEMMCIVRGSCTLHIGDVAVSVATGDTILVPPGTVHTVSVFSDDCLLYNNEIRFSTLREKFPSLLLSRNILSDLFRRALGPAAETEFIIFHAGDYYLGDNKLGDIVAEFRRNSVYSAEMVNLLTAAFLFDLLDRFAMNATHSTVKSMDRTDVLLMEYIAAHAQTVTLEELSRHFSYSDRHIARLVRKNTGLAYSQLIRRMKMDAIARLVTDSTLPIERIIEGSGISSPSYFYKSFKAYFGTTPSRYREKAQEQGAALVT